MFKKKKTMKKIQYIAPSIKVANIQLQTILAGSDFNVDKSDNDYTKDNFGAKGSEFDEDEDF